MRKLTQAEFLAKAVAVHGVGRYDYSRAVYVGGAKKVIIFCVQHGDFEQTANSHMMGIGCPGCAGVARLTTEIFVARARAQHRDKYDYSQVIYKSASGKVLIGCPEHGVFEQVAMAHLVGQGCRACAGTAPVSLACFLEKARAKFGNKYNYSQAKLKSNKHKVLIGCPIHGTFEQTPENHLIGYGCKRCGLGAGAQERTYDTELFIQKAQVVHNSRYDYSQTVYVSSSQKVAIRCPEHGIFKQSPASHLFGHRCPICMRERQAAAQLLDTASFVEKAKAVHGERYDYSVSVYVSSKDMVNIGCPIHGVFSQLAGAHMQGRGCERCGSIEMGKKRATGTAGFIARAQILHGGKYDYSQVVYVNGKEQVTITCPQHGTFNQVAGTHILGHGCPMCGREILAEGQRLSWVERAQGKRCTLYFIKMFDDGEEFYKIGITSQSVEIRYKSKIDLNGYRHETLAQHTSQDAARIYDWEQSILETFAHLRYHPKRSFGGETECFSEADPILAIFPL